MGVIDQALEANGKFAENYDLRQGGRPEPRLAVVTRMDPRVFDIEGMLGLCRSDMDLIRTEGAAVTEDTFAELLISTRILGVTEILVINHTVCGFTNNFVASRRRTSRCGLTNRPLRTHGVCWSARRKHLRFSSAQTVSDRQSLP